jgi:hypothetical protein
VSGQTAAKVTGVHLSRTAYLYVRQSTLRQVLTNTESAARQYALRQKAAALGWPAERIVTIDTDQGQSGASAADREGFQRLVAEVGMGRAGIVLGLEVSRLARNNADWHRLLQLCAMSRTLICGLHSAQDDYDKATAAAAAALTEQHKARIRALATDFPALWSNEDTPSENTNAWSVSSSRTSPSSRPTRSTCTCGCAVGRPPA